MKQRRRPTRSLKRCLVLATHRSADTRTTSPACEPSGKDGCQRCSPGMRECQVAGSARQGARPIHERGRGGCVAGDPFHALALGRMRRSALAEPRRICFTCNIRFGGLWRLPVRLPETAPTETSRGAITAARSLRPIPWTTLLAPASCSYGRLCETSRRSRKSVAADAPLRDPASRRRTASRTAVAGASHVTESRRLRTGRDLPPR